MKETSVMSFSHQHINNAASSIIENLNLNDVLKSKKLSNYYNKNLKKHSNFFHDVDTAFHLSFIYFQSNQKKILFMMQYLKKLFKKV